ncbi:NADPH cytochrome P450 oxidoreductase family protein [Viridibacterium curvum]|uniref:NADPH--hemoprotein reductase n=1 Tax=Viridibacterium curvum TaxID=1101404 RepID=A0ABP9QSP3_9RHOO
MLELVGNEARIAAALVLLLAYVAYCVFQYRRFHRAAGGSVADSTASSVWLIYASQTGQAEAIARHSAQALSDAGCPVRIARLDEPWMAQAAASRCVLFVVSTHGEGSAPDHVARFVRDTLQAGPQPALHGLRYGVLALGDRNYAQFCAFGRALDAWLAGSGALALFPRIEANQLDADSLASWSQALGKLGAAQTTSPLSDQVAFSPWQFVERTLLNPGSAGQALCKVVLRPAAGGLPDWQAGDLADVQLPEDPAHPRNYSVASLPGEGRIELIVRTRIREDGQRGLASGLLNETAQAGDTILLRVRRNAGFRCDAGTDTPLILIGAGAGLAGLRAHLMARARALAAAGLTPPERCAWLIFGERSSAHDRPCADEFARWQRERVLTRADFTFSRDQTRQPYVQDVLMANPLELRLWVDAGASLLICGAANTMAQGVDEALRSILGGERVDALVEAGRIRRDVF